MNLNELISANSYESEFEVCPGCENHCTVKLFHFQNGNTFFSGNNCEKVYSNIQEGQRKGVNLFAEKYKLLFQKPERQLPPDAPTIGIPRGLGIYENYPFWKTLFSESRCVKNMTACWTSSSLRWWKRLPTYMRMYSATISFPKET